jgi:hypothetical protein
MRLTGGADGSRARRAARWLPALAAVGLSACGPRPLDGLPGTAGAAGGQNGEGGTVGAGGTASGQGGAAGTGPGGTGPGPGPGGGAGTGGPRFDPQSCPVTASPPGTFSFVSAGNDGSCGIHVDGTLACWGLSYFAQPDPFPGTYKHVSKQGAICAVRATGALACWGDDATLLPVPTGAFAQVAVGEGMACARRDDGTVACWGYRPPYVPPGYVFQSLSGGAYSACGIESLDRAVVCWAPGVGAESVQVMSGPFTVVGTGRFYACGLRADGEVSCWPTAWPPGLDDSSKYGQLEAKSGPFVALAVGEMHACALRPDGKAACWGLDIYGQSQPPAGVSFTQISAGTLHTCGIVGGGRILCWGGSQRCGPEPIPIP